jgi:hypothetical protein
VRPLQRLGIVPDGSRSVQIVEAADEPAEFPGAALGHGQYGDLQNLLGFPARSAALEDPQPLSVRTTYRIGSGRARRILACWQARSDSQEHQVSTSPPSAGQAADRAA